MVNLGFVGLGGMGMGQVNTFARLGGCKIVAGADVSDKARAGFAQKFPGGGVYADYKALLRDQRVDAVVVVTPTLFHKESAVAAMKSGRPVLTEKPLARSVADCHKMIDASEKTRKVLMVAHCRRFDTDWGTFARIFKSGALGGPVLWRHVAAGTLPSPWFVDDKLGGGPLFDGAVHDHDFGNWIFGDPQDVLAREVRLGSATGVATASAIVRYKQGHQMTHCWSWDVSGGHFIDALSPRGSVSWGPGALASPDLDTKNFGYYCLNTKTPKGVQHKLYKFKRTDMYLTQAKHFLDCIAGKARCISPATEAIKGVAVGEAILKAARGSGACKVRW